MNEATQQFTLVHANDDVRLLALQGCRNQEVDMPLALQQIQGRQTASRKLPTWAAIDNILYPPHLSMEQCSSEQTARYKAAVLCGFPAKKKLVDLTGGLGVDFAFMSPYFNEAVYVEQQEELFTIAKANFATLGLSVQTILGDGVDYLHRLDYASVIFLDPARRDIHGARTFGIADCIPNVLPLLDELLHKASLVMLKLSPMLDWHKAINDIGLRHVEQVHIVSVGNECKELLLLLSEKGNPNPCLVCTNDDQSEKFMIKSSPLVSSSREVPQPSAEMGGTGFIFLYEPNASLMKAGVFAELAQRYGVNPLAPNSHLFTSEQPIAHFPGRILRISAISSMNKQELCTKILPLKSANISVRNFPLTVAELRKKLKLRDGGDNYLFATTLADGEHVLLVCQRVDVKHN